jgi:hypothetical protein
VCPRMPSQRNPYLTIASDMLIIISSRHCSTTGHHHPTGTNRYRPSSFTLQIHRKRVRTLFNGKNSPSTGIHIKDTLSLTHSHASTPLCDTGNKENGVLRPFSIQ